MDMTHYRLPDGRTVPVDATAAKGALEIGFTLIGGRIVTAVHVEGSRLHTALMTAIQAGLSNFAYDYTVMLAHQVRHEGRS